MKLKRVFIGVVTSSLLMTSVALADDEIDPLKNKIDEINQNNNSLEEKKEEIEKDIDSTEVKLAKSTEQLLATQSKINETQKQIDETKEKIESKQEAIKEKEKEIKVKEEEITEKERVLAENLRIMYQNGDTSILEVLFASKGLKEFVYRVDYMKIVANSHKKIRDEIIKMKKQLEKQKEKLESEKKELEELKTTQEAKKNELEKLEATQEAQKVEHEKLLANLENQHDHLEDEIAANNAAEAQIQAQIANIIRKREEERRRKEEERRRIEEENRKKQEAGQKPDPLPPSDDVVGSGQLAIPLPAGSYYISSPYGWRTDPITGERRFHSGQDWAAPDGTSIYAVDGGTVLFAGPASGYGNWIVIDHNNGLYSIYGHMWDSGVNVSPSQQVQRGQRIGAVGSNGRSTGAHLHLCIATGFNGYSFTYTDPMNYY